MPDPPLLVLRIQSTHHIITCARQMMRIILLCSPHPPPHPMILGTTTGHVLRKLADLHPLGREITIPPPHLHWRDVPPERWPAVYAEAQNLALLIERNFKSTARPGHWPETL